MISTICRYGVPMNDKSDRDAIDEMVNWIAEEIEKETATQHEMESDPGIVPADWEEE